MATMVETVSVEQRLQRLDETIADAETATALRIILVMEDLDDDAPDNSAAVDAMWADVDRLTSLRAEKLSLMGLTL